MRHVGRFVAFPVVLAVTVAGACEKKERDGKDRPAEPESAPVVGFLELPSGRDLGDAAKVVDAFQPGASAMLMGALTSNLPSWVGASSLDGADLDEPVRLVVGDPKKFSRPAVLLVHVADADALAKAAGDAHLEREDDLAVIGPVKAVAALAPYAFDVLADDAAPTSPRATVFVDPLLASYRKEIEGVKSAMQTAMAAGGEPGEAGEFVQIYFDGFIAAAEQSERIEIEVTGGAQPALVATIVPVKGSTFAEVVDAQRPAAFELVGELPPAASPAFLVAGELTLGPLREPLMALGNKIMPLVAGDVDDELMRRLMDQFSGEFAIVGSQFLPQPALSEVFTVKDGDEAREINVKVLRAMGEGQKMKFFGVEQTLEVEERAFSHRDVPVALQRAHIEGVAPAQAGNSLETVTYFTAFDDRMVMSMGDGARDDLEAMIDVAKGESEGLAIGERLATTIAEAERLRESVFLHFELGSLPAPVSGGVEAVGVGLGFGDGALRLRVGPVVAD